MRKVDYNTIAHFIKCGFQNYPRDKWEEEYKMTNIEILNFEILANSVYGLGTFIKLVHKYTEFI